MSNLYVIRTPSGLRKVGYSTSPARRCIDLFAHNTIGERGKFTVEYERACPEPIKDVEAHAHTLLADYRVKLEYFSADLDTARAAVNAAIDAASADGWTPPPRVAAEPKVMLQTKVNQEFVDRLDDWRRAQPDIPQRSEAIRRLIEIGLSA